MSSSLAFRHLHHLSSAAATFTTFAVTTTITSAAAATTSAAATATTTSAAATTSTAASAATTSTAASAAATSIVTTTTASAADATTTTSSGATTADATTTTSSGATTADAAAQESTVRSLATARRFSDIKTLLESRKTDPQIKNEEFVAAIIKSYGVVGMFDQALKTYNEMPKLGTPRSPISFNLVLSAFVRGRKFEKAVRMFDEMPKRDGFEPDKVSYGVLIKAYCAMGEVGLAMARLREMEAKGVEITSITYSTILHGLYQKGEVEEAERVWNEMVARGCVDVGGYNVRIMNAHGGDVEDVKGLIEEMRGKGFTPDVITYNYLITSYCKRGLMDEAIEVFGDLESNGCQPNAATFRTLVFYSCKKARFETAYDVFKQSVAAHRVPDFNTSKYLVEGLVKNSKVEEAKEIIACIKEKFPAKGVEAWEKVEKQLGLVIEHNTGGDENDIVGT